MAVCDDCGVWTTILLSDFFEKTSGSGSGSMLSHGAIVLSEKSSVFPVAISFK